MIRDVARTLRDLRDTVDNRSLDQVIRGLGDTFAEHTTRYEVEQFLDWSWYRRNTAGDQPDPQTEETHHHE